MSNETTQATAAGSSSQSRVGVIKASRYGDEEEDDVCVEEKFHLRKKDFSRTIVLSMGRNEACQLGFPTPNMHGLAVPKGINAILRSAGMEEGYERVESVESISNDERGYTIFLTNFRSHFYVCGSEMIIKKKKKKKGGGKQKQQQNELFPPLNYPTKVPLHWKDQNDYIQQVSLGSNHLFVLTHTGKIYGLGSNFSYQLGYPKSNYASQLVRVSINCGESIKSITCGVDCTFFITTSGSVFAAGDNEYVSRFRFTICDTS